MPTDRHLITIVDHLWCRISPTETTTAVAGQHDADNYRGADGWIRDAYGRKLEHALDYAFRATLVSRFGSVHLDSVLRELGVLDSYNAAGRPAFNEFSRWWASASRPLRSSR